MKSNRKETFLHSYKLDSGDRSPALSSSSAAAILRSPSSKVSRRHARLMRPVPGAAPKGAPPERPTPAARKKRRASVPGGNA